MQPAWIALIPAYQPTELLLSILSEAKAAGLQLVVVNDGSSERAKSIFRAAAQYGTVLHHPQNRGKGAALKTGLAYIQRHYPGECIVVTMDADGQHRVPDARAICRTAQEHPQALVLGSRRFHKDVPLRSLLGNTVTRLVYHISTGQRVWDTQTGLRGFGAQLIPRLLAIPGERYEYEMNVLLTCSRTGIPILEEEIDTIYLEGNASSHFDTVKDSCRIYLELLKFSAASFVSFLTDYGLYSLLTVLTGGMGGTQSLVLSNIGARVVSAWVNYTLNRRLVFRSSAGLVRSAGQYAALACLILAGNTLVLSLLADALGMNRYGAKLVTELFFFLISWVVQRRLIFRERAGAEGPQNNLERG